MQPRSLPTRWYVSARCYISSSSIGKSVHLLDRQTVYLVGITVVLVRHFIWSIWWHYNWARLYLQIFQNRHIGNVQVYQFSKTVSESSGHLVCVCVCVCMYVCMYVCVIMTVYAYTTTGIHILVKVNRCESELFVSFAPCWFWVWYMISALDSTRKYAVVHDFKFHCEISSIIFAICSLL
jgi:hypothetical protein